MTTNIANSAVVPATGTHFPSRLNTRAPDDKVSKIISRSSSAEGVFTYTLQVGDIAVPDVSIAEVSDFVSAYDLEVFENQEFEREIKEEAARQKERLAVKTQARVSRQNRSVSSSDGDGSVSGTSVSGENKRTTAGGRQRPTYTHFYPKQRAPRGSSKAAISTRNGDHRDNKRRRLREDRDRSMASAHDAESIYSVASLDPPTQPPSAMEQAAGMLTDTHESDPMELDEESGNDNDIDMPIRQQTTTSGEVAREKNKAATSAFFTFRDQPKSSRILSAKEKLVASLTARQATESTMPPASASNSINPNTNNSSRQAVVDLNDSESEEDSDGSEVYTVEKILAHNKSDPSSHNKSVHGEKPVMLYLVKWEGYDDTTWEPATSFQDDDVLQEYWSQQAQKQKPSKDTAILKGQRKGL